MSQHHFRSTHNGRPVLVVAGWDRPLQYVFMTVNYVDRGESGAEFLYSNLDDENALTNLTDSEYFLDVLNSLNIQTPTAMWEAIYVESILGGSNRQVEYEMDGTVARDSSCDW